MPEEPLEEDSGGEQEGNGGEHELSESQPLEESKGEDLAAMMLK